MSLIDTIGSGISHNRDCVLSVLELLVEKSLHQMIKFSVFIKVSWSVHKRTKIKSWLHVLYLYINSFLVHK